MVNIVWLVMIVFEFSWPANGNIDVVTKAALDGANDAVKISLSLIAIISFWLGIMKLARPGWCGRWPCWCVGDAFSLPQFPKTTRLWEPS